MNDESPDAYHLPDLAAECGRSLGHLLDMAQRRVLTLSCTARRYTRAANSRAARERSGYERDGTYVSTVTWRPPSGSLVRILEWGGDLRDLLTWPGPGPNSADGFPLMFPPSSKIMLNVMDTGAVPVVATWFEVPMPAEIAESVGHATERLTIGSPGLPLTLGDLWVQHADALAAGLLTTSLDPREERIGRHAEAVWGHPSGWSRKESKFAGTIADDDDANEGWGPDRIRKALAAYRNMRIGREPNRTKPTHQPPKTGRR